MKRLSVLAVVAVLALAGCSSSTEAAKAPAAAKPAPITTTTLPRMAPHLERWGASLSYRLKRGAA